MGKISGPLLDRIAIHMNVNPVDIEAWSGVDRASRLTSTAMRDLVMRAREAQALRFVNLNGIDCNARMSEKAFTSMCEMERSAELIFVQAQKSLLVSARARSHIIRVARTIADLDGRATIADHHVTEAVGYRARK